MTTESYFPPEDDLELIEAGIVSDLRKIIEDENTELTQHRRIILESFRGLRIGKYFMLAGILSEPSFVDFTVLGLVTQPAVYGTGGVKLMQTYSTPEGEWVVRKSFALRTTGVLIQFEWANLDGSVGLAKTEVKPLNPVEFAKLYRANRERVVLFLQATAKGQAIEPYVNAIFAYFKNEIDLWVYSASDVLQTAMYLEGVDHPAYGYLAIQLVPPSEELPNGVTVRDSIMLQITADVEATLVIQEQPV